MEGNELKKTNVVQIECGKTDKCYDEDNFLTNNSGKYYYQVSAHTTPVTNIPSTKRDAEIHKKIRIGKNEDKSTITLNEYNEDKSDEDMDFVLILDNATAVEINSNELDSNDLKTKVYVFNENDRDGKDTPETKDLIFSKNVIRLKSNRQDSETISHSCIHCDYTTNKRYLLSRHLRAHSDDRPYRCSVCERGFKSNASLLNHVNTHLGNKPHICKRCEMAFTTSGELVRHVRYKHTLEKPHKCTECDYASVELSKLKRHMRCHTGERPYQCPHCTYASPDTFKLKRHMRTHTGEKPYECDICHARFTQSNSMKAHRMIHSVGEKPVFQCSLCPTTCGRKTDLRIHIQKLHHSDEPINCKRCSKSFPDRYTYKMHIKTHEGEKCYRCTVCPYASISLRHLESHLLIHTDQKPFVCEICELSFRQKQLLKRHINLYHNKFYIPPKPLEKRHACPDCKRSFSHKGNLMRHMESHDPDSYHKQEKFQLKLGRKTRVSEESSLELVSENEVETEEYYVNRNYYNKETEEELEIRETLDEGETERKSVVHHSLLNKVAEGVNSFISHAEVSPDIQALSIKKELDGKQFVSVEGTDGQEYVVVEVIHCVDEEGETGEAESLMNVQVKSNVAFVNEKKPAVDNFFGYEDIDSDVYVEDSDNKETIQLLEIIDED